MSSRLPYTFYYIIYIIDKVLYDLHSIRDLKNDILQEFVNIKVGVFVWKS